MRLGLAIICVFSLCRFSQAADVVPGISDFKGPHKRDAVARIRALRTYSDSGEVVRAQVPSLSDFLEKTPEGKNLVEAVMARKRFQAYAAEKKLLEYAAQEPHQTLAREVELGTLRAQGPNPPKWVVLGLRRLAKEAAAQFPQYKIEETVSNYRKAMEQKPELLKLFTPALVFGQLADATMHQYALKLNAIFSKWVKEDDKRSEIDAKFAEKIKDAEKSLKKAEADYNNAVEKSDTFAKSLGDAQTEGDSTAETLAQSLSDAQLQAGHAQSAVATAQAALQSTKDLAQNPSQSYLAQLLKRVLKNQVPQAVVESRVTEFLTKPPTRASLAGILGAKTLAETDQLYFGQNPLQPSPESLIGQYIAKTGAKTVVKQFSAGPDRGGAVGPKRLVVAVSPESLEEFQKLFFRNDAMSVVGHALVINNGRVNSYNNTNGDFRAPSPGNILPLTLFSSTEGQRLEAYLQYVGKNRHRGFGGNNQSMYPNEVPGYDAAHGCWAGCTQWIGNMPIADIRVSEYKFPKNRMGEVDEVNSSQLQPHQAPEVDEQFHWRFPGRAQFAELLGLMQAQTRGELANPGWLITTLLAATTQARVPVVFWFTADHKLEIPENFVFNFENPH